MKPIRAVLFDFAGTLCTFATIEAAARASTAELAVALGLAGHAEDVFAAVRTGIGQAFRAYAGRPFYLHRDLFAEGYRHGLTSLGATFADSDVMRALAAFDAHQAAGFALREGTMETLAELRARGLRLGIVSNADEEQLAGWVALGRLGQSVDFALSSEAARSCKPDGGIFAQALHRADCEPDAALFVGDTPDHDVDGANGAGIRSVLLRPAEALNLPWPRGVAEPNHVINSIPELLSIVDATG